MDLQYDGTDLNTNGFVSDEFILVSLNQPPKRAYGLLLPIATLGMTRALTIHAAVDERTFDINHLVCQLWQGNRNPFGDHPELAQAILGSPTNTLTDSVKRFSFYESCEDVPTFAAPTLHCSQTIATPVRLRCTVVSSFPFSTASIRMQRRFSCSTTCPVV